MKHTFPRWIWIAVVLAWARCGAFAVVIAGGDGRGNTNAPVSDPGWANVGQFNSGQNSAVYLGNGWVLTAWHVKSNDSPTQVRFAGTWYGLDTTSWTRITNANGTRADMVLVRATNAPPLADVTLRTTQIPNNASLVMVGNGRLRHPTNTYWNAAWQPTNQESSVHAGFLMTEGFLAQRWGSNTVNNAEKSVSVGDSYFAVTTTSFSVSFDGGLSGDEAQATVGDSGGAVFYKSGGTWELVGMMYNVGVVSGQPWPSTIVYGDKTWSANLTTSVYRAQIEAVIPEPATAALIAAAAAVLGIVRRRRRSAHGSPPP